MCSPDPAAGGHERERDPGRDVRPARGLHRRHRPQRGERGVEARGNEVRETAVGCFEVDSGNNIISKAPSGYPLN